MLACSYAFMLPAATAPNAIVMLSKHVHMLDMVTAGLAMNVVCVASTVVAVHVWTGVVFDYGGMPRWALEGAANATCFVNAVNGTSTL